MQNNHHFGHLTIALVLSILMLALLPLQSNAAIEEVQFEDEVTELRYQKLIAELRCLVCQNQNLADSNADLAKDLRSKTEAMLKDGKSDQEILTFMSDRYGDFVLYRPPFNTTTAALWLGPYALLLIALIGLFITIRRRQAGSLMSSSQSGDEDQRAQVRNLLRDAPSLDGDSTNLTSKSD